MRFWCVLNVMTSEMDDIYHLYPYRPSAAKEYNVKHTKRIPATQRKCAELIVNQLEP